MSISNPNSRSLLSVALAASCLVIGLSTSVVDARGGGGGGHRGGGGARASAPTSVNRPSGNASANRGSGNVKNSGNRGNTNINNSGNRNNVNVNNNNVNVNRNTNVNVDVDNHHGGGWNDYDNYHPVARGVAVGTAAAITAAAIGSIVYSVPPSCTTVIVNNVSYSQCGSTWYQPQYSGSSVQYVVVNSPQ